MLVPLPLLCLRLVHYQEYIVGPVIIVEALGIYQYGLISEAVSELVNKAALAVLQVQGRDTLARQSEQLIRLRNTVVVSVYSQPQLGEHRVTGINVSVAVSTVPGLVKLSERKVAIRRLARRLSRKVSEHFQ